MSHLIHFLGTFQIVPIHSKSFKDSKRFQSTQNHQRIKKSTNPEFLQIHFFSGQVILDINLQKDFLRTIENILKYNIV